MAKNALKAIFGNSGGILDDRLKKITTAGTDSEWMQNEWGEGDWASKERPPFIQKTCQHAS